MQDAGYIRPRLGAEINPHCGSLLRSQFAAWRRVRQRRRTSDPQKCCLPVARRRRGDRARLQSTDARPETLSAGGPGQTVATRACARSEAARPGRRPKPAQRHRRDRHSCRRQSGARPAVAGGKAAGAKTAPGRRRVAQAPIVTPAPVAPAPAAKPTSSEPPLKAEVTGAVPEPSGSSPRMEPAEPPRPPVEMALALPRPRRGARPDPAGLAAQRASRSRRWETAR